ncbi:ubiquitin carboxyl-terminal hydrolase CYLD [Corythoichthys intestinalis]|uniref:ubiquitin carboxyl-terminal hydrolase CYLD n=1 Tax=Corythoichthys intestinalis TaxID=161448 RepID=UPI0025A6264B|nr:ubiquitin carboxyl-terminal hydrolase CYLD [Corythoichthys intestinalis]XP_061814111.1 ubiquitin carboxyl-terminal hydrolase CYLD-like [Nerophis lumbriciformis]
MESNTVLKDKFFIVTRGKSRKGFSRGSIGRVASETQGELTGLLYGAGPHAGSPQNGGVVRREDTYRLTRQQAQLLLFVSSVTKRFELLCNPQLFSAICELTVDDLVVVKDKKGHLPGLVKNLMQIGKKENKDDLQMLGFEVEFVNHDVTSPSKKSPPLHLFSAAEITQVVPSYSIPLGLNWNAGQHGTNKKAVTRNNSMPNMKTYGQVKTHRTEQSISPSPNLNTSHAPLEVGSMVEVMSNIGVTAQGVVRWLGVPGGKTSEWAGIELDFDVNGCSDGTYGGQRLFTCKKSRALFVPVTKCSPDSRFVCSTNGNDTISQAEIPPVPPYVDSEDYVAPIAESEVASLLVGRMKGIQGHINSCYLDATLFSLFNSSVALDNICQKPADTVQPVASTLRKIVTRLRRQGFVPAASVMNFRHQLGCDSFRTEEKDPEEFITLLFQKVLGIEPMLKLRSSNESCEGAYTFQIFLEKEQMAQIPTVQQLLDTSCLSSDVKFEEIPSCLIVQMPRFGNKYKMFSHIIPSVELEITDLLYNSFRQCFICGQMAEHECLQCLPDRKMDPGRIKQYCTTCNTQVHRHSSRQGHSPKPLSIPAEVASASLAPRHTMQLFAVLCIHTSHYVSFVKFGPDPHSWLFFDSMADRCGDDERGFNIPEIRACPELGDFLAQSEEMQAQVNPSHAPELVRRLLCDSYMFLYQ